MRRPSTSHGRRNLRTRRGSAPSFGDIDGLIADYDPISSRTVLNGSNVNTVEDGETSDGQQNATQGTAADQPAYTSSNGSLNSRPSVDHDSSSGEWLDIGDNLDPGASHFLFVGVLLTQTTASNTEQRLFQKRGRGGLGAQAGFVVYAHSDFDSVFPSGGDGDNDGFSFQMDDGSRGVWAGGDTRVDDGSPHIVEGWFDADTNTAKTAVDGTEGTEDTQTSITVVSTSRNATIGCYWDSSTQQGQFFNGSWARILVYRRSSPPFEDSEREQIRNKLASTYGVSL